MKSPYQFGPGGAKTHRWIKIARGTSERTIAMSIVSNSAAEVRDTRTSAYTNSQFVTLGRVQLSDASLSATVVRG